MLLLPFLCLNLESRSWNWFGLKALIWQRVNQIDLQTGRLASIHSADFNWMKEANFREEWYSRASLTATANSFRGKSSHVYSVHVRMSLVFHALYNNMQKSKNYVSNFQLLKSCQCRFDSRILDFFRLSIVFWQIYLLLSRCSIILSAMCRLIYMWSLIYYKEYRWKLTTMVSLFSLHILLFPLSRLKELLMLIH